MNLYEQACGYCGAKPGEPCRTVGKVRKKCRPHKSRGFA